VVVNGEGNDIPDDDSNDSISDSNIDQTSHGVILSRLGIQCEACVRRILIWKNETKGKDQKFGSANACRYNMCKYALAHHFEYVFARNF